MGINSGQVVKKPDITIDPNFFLPPNLSEVEYKVEQIFGDDSPQDLVDENGEVVVLVEPFNAVTEDGSFGTLGDSIQVAEDKLPVPGKPTLVSQTTRATPGGNIVIDVVLDVPDIPGIQEVDIRISKIL